MEQGKTIKIGTCGFGDFKPAADERERFGSKLGAYAQNLGLLEVNSTFYQLPMINTCARWQNEAGENFEFTVKAWQGITHPTSSPTWRKRLGKLTEKQRDELGNLRPTDSVIEAWEETKLRAKAMGASICVVQTPSSFGCTWKNRDNMSALFSAIDRVGLLIAWEPRGDWNEHPEEIKALCEDLNLIHVVDLLRRSPLSSSSTAYIRLHGLNKKEYDYNYDYSLHELQELAQKLHDLTKTYNTVYCLFNNLNMHKNALGLEEILNA